MTKLTAKEMLEIVSQQWATAKDIEKIGSCGINKAQQIKKDIKDKLFLEENKIMPYGVVPMEKVVEYFNININYLRRVSK